MSIIDLYLLHVAKNTCLIPCFIPKLLSLNFEGLFIGIKSKGSGLRSKWTAHGGETGRSERLTLGDHVSNYSGAKHRPLSSWTVNFDLNDSPVWLNTFGCTVYLRATVHFKDHPLSPLWTVHFGPDSFLGLQVLELFSTLARSFENFRIFAKFELGNFGFGNGLKVKKDIHYEQLSL